MAEKTIMEIYNSRNFKLAIDPLRCRSIERPIYNSRNFKLAIDTIYAYLKKNLSTIVEILNWL